jgi:hypothetical protein
VRPFRSRISRLPRCKPLIHVVRSKSGIAKALRCRFERRFLSVPDSFALALARTLVTGYGDLRELATGENVNCHGVLWLLDRMDGSRRAASRGCMKGSEQLSLAINAAGCRAGKLRSGWSAIGPGWLDDGRERACWRGLGFASRGPRKLRVPLRRKLSTRTSGPPISG